MAIKYGFYNSISGDRKYNAEDFGRIFDGIIRDGVFESIYDKFQITILSGLSVSVGKGKAWFNNTWLENDANYPVSFTEAEVLLNRIDAVVMEFNSTEGVRANSIKVITGTPGSTPQKPTLTNTDNVNQYALCYVTIPAKATSITTANLDVRIGATDCPYVVVESGEIPSLKEINKLINDVATLDTKVDDTVEGLSYLDKNGDGFKVLTNDGTYKTLSPILIDTLTVSGIFNPTNYTNPYGDPYARYIFVLYGAGGDGGDGAIGLAAAPNEIKGGGGGGAGGKTITPKLLINTPTPYVIGAARAGSPDDYNDGYDGGNTTILTYVAGGGRGGQGYYWVSWGDGGYYKPGAGGAGGTGTVPGQPGAGGATQDYPSGGIGGSSEVGVGGRNGGPATGKAAGGGGGTATKTSGGSGTPGLMLVYGLVFNEEV